MKGLITALRNSAPGLLLLFVFWGCGTASHDTSAEITHAIKNDTLPPANLRPASAWEQPISRQEFNRFWKPVPVLKDEYTAPWGKKVKFSEMLQQTGDSVIELRLGGHRSLFLKDTLVGTQDTNQVDFQFDGYIEETGHYRIAKLMFADFDTWLIDITDGKITPMEGVPAVSPSHRFILSYCSDLDQFILPNGFQLYEMTEQGLVYRKGWFQPYYAPMELYFDSDTSVVLRAVDQENVSKMREGAPLQESFYRINLNQMPDKDELKPYFYKVVLPAREKQDKGDSANKQ